MDKDDEIKFIKNWAELLKMLGAKDRDENGRFLPFAQRFDFEKAIIEKAPRVVACVNALEGIEDPELFVRQAKQFMAAQYCGLMGDGLEGEFE